MVKYYKVHLVIQNLSCKELAKIFFKFNNNYILKNVANLFAKCSIPQNLKAALRSLNHPMCPSQTCITKSFCSKCYINDKSL